MADGFELAQLTSRAFTFKEPFAAPGAATRTQARTGQVRIN
jgi:hypothetical protein